MFSSSGDCTITEDFIPDLTFSETYDIENIDYLVNGLIELLLKYSLKPPLNINRLTEPRYVEPLYEKLLITYYLPVYKTKIKRWEKGLPDKVVKIFK